MRVLARALILLLALVGAGSKVACVSAPLNMECFPNATILADNPDPAIYITVIAAGEGGACTTLWKASADNSTQNAVAVITGCEKDTPIVLTFTSREENESSIYAGAQLVSYLIECSEIDSAGVTKFFTQGFTPSIDESTVSFQSPTFEVTSAIRSSSEVGEEQTEVTVGEEVYWTIDVPVEYTAIPAKCTAYAGTSPSSTLVQSLVFDGWSLDPHLLENFSDSKVTIIGGVKRYYTKMWAFKFIDHDHVFLTCSIKLCPAGSPYCLMESRRKRRTPNESGVEYGSTSLTLLVSGPKKQTAQNAVSSIMARDLAIGLAVLLLSVFLILLLH